MSRDRGPARTVAAELRVTELLAAGILGAVLLSSLVVWAGGELAGRVAGGRWPQVAPAVAPLLLARILRTPASAPTAWPAGARRLLPGAALLDVAILFTTLVMISVVVAGAWVARALLARVPRPGPAGNGPVHWARSRELRALRTRGRETGRLVLGRHAQRLIATDGGHSVLVLGPTQSMKTAGFAIPAILEWHGPVLATSVKTDLVRTTVAARRAGGQAWIFDPANVTSMPRASWTPLAGCATWQGAQRMSSWLVGAAQVSGSSLADADFWYATATKLLAPLLFAAAISGRGIADVVRWVDTQERAQVEEALLLAGEPAALVAAGASWDRDARQRSSTFAVVETVLAAYADPGVLSCSRQAELDPTACSTVARTTAYLCAPAHEQARLRPVFTALVQELLTVAFERADARGRGLDPPLLVVLDEAANIAPLRELDALAATASSHGIQLVTVFQDLAQARARYGERATTIVNNHRAKVLLSGISDAYTLDYASALIGETEVRQLSATSAPGVRSTTASPRTGVWLRPTSSPAATGPRRACLRPPAARTNPAAAVVRGPATACARRRGRLADQESRAPGHTRTPKVRAASTTSHEGSGSSLTSRCLNPAQRPRSISTPVSSLRGRPPSSGRSSGPRGWTASDPATCSRHGHAGTPRPRWMRSRAPAASSQDARAPASSGIDPIGRRSRSVPSRLRRPATSATPSHQRARWLRRSGRSPSVAVSHAGRPNASAGAARSGRWRSAPSRRRSSAAST